MHIKVSEIINSTQRLPSLPGVAMEIIALSNETETTVEEVVSLVSKDPAISSRLLRIVNSPLYVKASPRGVESLKQAIVIIGLDPSLNLALSFSLLPAFKKKETSGIDYELYWRRALLSALSARVLGVQLGEVDMEALFLSALLQDIGMLVIDQLYPDFYAELEDEQQHYEQLLNYERKRMFTDHAQIGGLILDKWKLPKRTCKTVLRSHDPSDVEENHSVGRFVRCVALSGHFADLFLCGDKYDVYQVLVSKAYAYLHIKETGLLEMIEKIAGWIPDTEELFAKELVSPEMSAGILDQAHTTWVSRVGAH